MRGSVYNVSIGSRPGEANEGESASRRIEDARVGGDAKTIVGATAIEYGVMLGGPTVVAPPGVPVVEVHHGGRLLLGIAGAALAGYLLHDSVKRSNAMRGARVDVRKARTALGHTVRRFTKRR